MGSMEKEYSVEDQNRSIRVQLDNDQALITGAGRSFHVSPRDRASALSNCPMELVLGALGACIMLTLKAVAGQKGITLVQPDVRLGYTRNPDGETRFRVALRLDDHLTDRERKILYQSARICEVGKILRGDVRIDYLLETQSPEKGPETRQYALG